MTEVVSPLLSLMQVRVDGWELMIAYVWQQESLLHVTWRIVIVMEAVSKFCNSKTVCELLRWAWSIPVSPQFAFWSHHEFHDFIPQWNKDVRSVLWWYLVLLAWYSTQAHHTHLSSYASMFWHLEVKCSDGIANDGNVKDIMLHAEFYNSI